MSGCTPESDQYVMSYYDHRIHTNIRSSYHGTLRCAHVAGLFFVAQQSVNNELGLKFQNKDDGGLYFAVSSTVKAILATSRILLVGNFYYMHREANAISFRMVYKS
jgi:hypothetical protein